MSALCHRPHSPISVLFLQLVFPLTSVLSLPRRASGTSCLNLEKTCEGLPSNVPVGTSSAYLKKNFDSSAICLHEQACPSTTACPAFLRNSETSQHRRPGTSGIPCMTTPSASTCDLRSVLRGGAAAHEPFSALNKPVGSMSTLRRRLRYRPKLSRTIEEES